MVLTTKYLLTMDDGEAIGASGGAGGRRRDEAWDFR